MLKVLLTIPLVEKIAALAVIGGVILVVILLFLLFYLSFQAYKKYNTETQDLLTDRELLELFAEEPDGLMNAERLEQRSPLTKKEAKKRLYYLYMQGLLHPFHTSSLKAQYSLKEKAVRVEPPVLSNQPWLTVEDMINLFKLHDYKLSVHRICMSTGLPVSVIIRELKYFEKEKVIQKLYSTTGQVDTFGSMQQTYVYVLREPYRSDPDAFLRTEGEALDLELEKMYKDKIKLKK